MNASPRVFVLGASGMIGRNLTAANPDWIKIDFDQPHVMDLASYDVAARLPDYFRSGDRVVFCAAISKPNICENEPGLCWRVNVASTGALIERMLDRGVRVIFFSSDLVFDGSGDSYGEEDAHAPVGVYGKTKSAIEQRFWGEAHFKVARLSYVLSTTDAFSSQLIDHARTGQHFSVFDPLLRSVVYVGDLVVCIENLVASFDDIHYGIINCGGPTLASRKDMVDAFLRASGRSIPMSFVRPGPEFYKLRPERINLRTERFNEVLGRPPKSLDEAYTAILGNLSKLA